MPAEKSYMEQIRDDIEEMRVDLDTIAAGTNTPSITTFWTDSTLVAALAQVQSSYGFFPTKSEFFIIKNSTGGTYVFEIDWSLDGAAAFATQTVDLTSGSAVVKVASPYARFRVKNTHATNAFTAHGTSVGYR